jgi:hypothetical protein
VRFLFDFVRAVGRGTKPLVSLLTDVVFWCSLSREDCCAPLRLFYARFQHGL